jgi:hypothetical protein
MLNQLAPDDDATVKILAISPAVPLMDSLDPGVEDPIPSLPLEPKLNISAPVEDAIARAYGVVEVPRTVRVAIGVVVPPIPMLPFARTVKILAPVEEDTINGLVPAVPLRLKVTVDDVALIPSTVPLSMSVEVPRVVGESQRVAHPNAPPEREETIPREEVATHLVDVPVAWRIIPRVPVLLVES